MIRVLVVDDSPSVRELLVRLLRSDSAFEVVGTARDGQEAVDLAARLRPDVITMDVQMPRLDGVAATRRIMAETPVPIVVVSASTVVKQVSLAFAALQAGAVTVTTKPPGPGHPRHAAAAQEFLTTVRLMAEVKVVRRRFANAAAAADAAAPAEPAAALPSVALRPLAIAIAASTGGPAAIEVVLRALGRDVDVPIFIVQHMSAGFLAGMVAWLASTCPQPVRLAAQGEQPVGGVVYLAPEDHHLLVTRHGTLRLSKAPLVNGFRPSGDVLFQSVAECYGARALGIVLTGMGADGAAGLAALRAAGAHTIAQDEETSVVYGMPSAAAAAGAAAQVLPLPKIGAAARGLLALKSAAG